ncbi:MAG: triose-phosphate isomerase [Defluviitaleaceae bacterium]|nr:triose-phosphate isomerase [Defluviitaleaceae bacterium]
MRRKVVAGNWKMNHTSATGADFAAGIAPKFQTSAEVVFCVPYTNLWCVKEAVKDYPIGIGAQNLHYEDSGAFTGEVSADMLLKMEAKYVIVGHSERRAYYNETDETVNKKLKKAVSKGLTPIVCVGEQLTQREQGITEDLLRMQVRIAYMDVDAETALATIIAYEPVWAIGTGKTATPDQAQQACACVREVFGVLYGTDAASKIRILYGGSVTGANAKDLFDIPDIDGGLVGGASLKTEFVDIVNAVK